MSRYFNETGKADNWSADALTAKLDIAELLSSMQAQKEVAQSPATSKASVAPQLTVPVSLDVPLLTRRDDNVARAAESYRILRTRILRLQASRGIRSIVFSSALPGDGKTLTTLNLGLCCSQLANLPVLIVDADFRTRGLTHLLGCTTAMGLSQFLSDRASTSEVLLKTNYPNLSVVPTGAASTSPAELFATTKWKEFLDWAGATYRLILVDSPPVLPLTDFELISAACDGVVFVIRGGLTNREMIGRARAQLDSQKLLGSVFNMSQQSNQVNYQGYSESALLLKENG
jgi:protein-tyrosine kinase